jgi:hypothetical protein
MGEVAMTTQNPPIKTTDTKEYQAFITECLVLITARNRVFKAQAAQRDCFDQNTAAVKSMRRLVPLAKALYPLLSGDDGPRLVRRGKRAVYISSSGHVWVNDQHIAWEE